MKKKQKIDVAQLITDKMIEIIQKTKRLIWHKEWSCGFGLAGPNAPRNFVTKKAYRGCNTLMLSAQGYESPWWMTFKQAKAKGGSIIKGSKGTMVVWFDMLLLDKNGVRVTDPQLAEKKIPLLKYSTVFNAEQISGIDFPAPAKIKEQPTAKRIEAAEAVLDGYKTAPPTKFGGNRACYSPALDRISMPAIEQFNTEESFYKTYFHEAIHSTGHKDRLSRKGITEFDKFGSEQYSKEELIAELGAAFLASITDCWDEKQQNNSAAYLNGWCSALKEDPKMLISAASAAQKAAEYILGRPLDDAAEEHEASAVEIAEA